MQPKPQWPFSPETLPACLLWEFGPEHRECGEDGQVWPRDSHRPHPVIRGQGFPLPKPGYRCRFWVSTTSTALSLHLCSLCQDGTTSPGHSPFSIQHICRMSRGPYLFRFHAGSNASTYPQAVLASQVRGGSGISLVLSTESPTFPGTHSLSDQSQDHIRSQLNSFWRTTFLDYHLLSTALEMRVASFSITA